MSMEMNKALVEQAGGDERAAFELFVRKHCGMPAHIAVNWDAKFTNDAWEGWQARAALAQPSLDHAVQAHDIPMLIASEHANPDYAMGWNDCRAKIIGASSAVQAEAERPEVVGYRIMRAQVDKIYQRVDKAAAEYEAGRSALGYMEDIAEAALCLRNRLDDLLAAAPAQAQHSVPGIAESVSECMALAQTVFARMEGLMPRGKKLPEKHVARRLLAELETLAKLAAAPAQGGETDEH